MNKVKNKKNEEEEEDSPPCPQGTSGVSLRSSAGLLALVCSLLGYLLQVTSYR